MDVAIETFETVFQELHSFGIDQLKANQLQLGRNIRNLLAKQGLRRYMRAFLDGVSIVSLPLCPFLVLLVLLLLFLSEISHYLKLHAPYISLCRLICIYMYIY